MYIVRKYIKATNLKQAIRLEPKVEVHDCYIDNEWQNKHLADAIGFDDGNYDDEEEI